MKYLTIATSKTLDTDPLGLYYFIIVTMIHTELDILWLKYQLVDEPVFFMASKPAF